MAGMQGYLDDGYAEAVPDDNTEHEGMTWYIPHHAVLDPKSRTNCVLFLSAPPSLKAHLSTKQFTKVLI